MKTTKRIIIGLLAALTVLSASLATATAANELYGESRLSTVSSSNEGFVNAAGDTSTGGVGIALGYELGMVDQIALRPLLMYDVQGFDGWRFDGDLRTRWGRQQLMVGADVGYDIFTWLRPMARLAMGYSHQSLTFTAGGQDYRDTAHGMSGLVAGGLEASIGRSPMGTDPISRLSLGANMLFGYTFQTEAHFDEMTSVDAPEEPTDEDPWRRATYDADTIQASGFAFSFGVSLRYRF